MEDDVGQTPVVHVEFLEGRLLLTEHRDSHGSWFAFPSRAGAGSARLTLDEALSARIRPTGTAEQVLRTWRGGTTANCVLPPDEPGDAVTRGQRGAALVVRDQAVLAIQYPAHRGGGYYFPGGGVEPGETPEQAAVRELKEETGLAGHITRELATVYNRGREEHYFLVAAEGEPTTRQLLDLHPGERLRWLPIDELPTVDIWPKRLAWRVASWAAEGWPRHPAVLSDSMAADSGLCDW